MDPKRIKLYVEDGDFCCTYGVGLSNVDVSELIEFHKKQKSLATVTAVQPPGRFGALNLERQRVTGFQEMPLRDGVWINGGFFVLNPKVIDTIEGDGAHWEREPLERLAAEGRLAAYRHAGYWLPMDTLRDKNQLESLWDSGRAPWRIWT